MEQMHTLVLRAELSKFWHNQLMTWTVPNALADQECLADMITDAKNFLQSAELLLKFMKEDSK